LPYSGINLSYSNAGTIGTMDGEILISLKAEHHATADYVKRLRGELPKRFPGVEFFFQPADIVTQILNFGLPAALDIQVAGNNLPGDYAIASKLMKEVKTVPGTVDVHIHQRMNQPTLALSMDRTQIKQLGLNPVDVAQNVLVSLSGSFQTAPAFWLNPNNGIVYNIAVQTPQYQIDDLDSLLRTPVNGGGAASSAAIAAGNGLNSSQMLSNLVSVKPAETQAVVSHYNIAPVIDLYVSVENRDLGGVSAEVEKLVEKARVDLPRGTRIEIRGQVDTMHSSFIGLGIGLAMAIVLVYLLIVVNFQSWVDPFIIITALPAALAGIAWMLFLTNTTLSVPALTGAIMTMGVATANSILMVSFARQRMQEGLPPLSAALEAGATRIRPVLMTALAMIIGMVPMAIGLGEGAEQNAPLGRAVIGGLLFATISTLFFVPIVFAGIHRFLEHRKKNSSGPSAGTHSSSPVVEGNP
jgi:multidrug efflux pump subunit AcrB